MEREFICKKCLEENVGGYIKSVRQAKGITFEELGEMSGLSPSYIYRLERGEKKNPSYTALTALTEALGIDINEIVVTLNSSNSVAEEDSIKCYNKVTLAKLLYSSPVFVDEEAKKPLSALQKELLLKIINFIDSDATCWEAKNRVFALAELSEMVDKYLEDKINRIDKI